jgi:DNA-binding transcriptional LysR family regulator
VTQPALSKQIIDIEKQHRFQLFMRDKKRFVELTEAGRVFIEEARSALLHSERAVHLARAAHEGCDRVFLIGHSPCAELAWISAMLAIRLPLYPKIKIRFMTEFVMELVKRVLAGEFHIGIVT